MILECIATGLLACGIAFTNTHVNNDNHYGSSDTHISESITPNYAYNSNNIKGIYNLRNYYDGDYNDKYDVPYYYGKTYTYTFDSSTYLMLCPSSWGLTNPVYYINSISISFDTDRYFYVDIDFYTSELASSDYSFAIPFDLGSLEVITSGWQNFIFQCYNTYSFNDEYIDVFNAVFTLEDNYYVTSYSGYYNFNSNWSYQYLSGIDFFGTTTFNNSMFTYFEIGTNADIQKNFIDLGYFDFRTNYYATKRYYLPFNSNEIVGSNVYLSGKMSTHDYNALGSIGVFGYVRDTSHDNTTFHDLLFTLMDVPVYFITRFFNFELFGMNLAVAFAGLVTLAVMLFVIRIIWRLN